MQCKKIWSNTRVQLWWISLDKSSLWKHDCRGQQKGGLGREMWSPGQAHWQQGCQQPGQFCGSLVRLAQLRHDEETCLGHRQDFSSSYTIQYHQGQKANFWLLSPGWVKEDKAGFPASTPEFTLRLQRASHPIMFLKNESRLQVHSMRHLVDAWFTKTLSVWSLQLQSSQAGRETWSWERTQSFYSCLKG